LNARSRRAALTRELLENSRIPVGYSGRAAERNVTWHLKEGIVKPEETAVVRKLLGKHVPKATNTHAIIEELLGAMFSM
jgi:hypothetical protein